VRRLDIPFCLQDHITDGLDQTPPPGKSAEERRAEIDNLISSLVDRPRDSIAASPSRGSRPNSVFGTGQVTPQNGASDIPSRPQMQSASTQTLTAGTTATVFEVAPEASKTQREYITYNKGVQTEPYVDAATGARDQSEDESTSQARKHSSRREQERDEEIRARLRKEIEEELRATQTGSSTEKPPSVTQQRYPLRRLTSDELSAVATSTEFVSFVERSSKVIERALDEDYDLLADYTLADQLHDSDEEPTPYSRTSKKSHSLRQTLQLYSERHSRKRMVSDLQFSPHFPELLLTSYTKNPSAPNEPAGLVLLWNTHAPSRPEYTFHAGTDVLSARFSPFHPNLIIGGCYSGQICLWDTRSSGRTGAPVQKTPMSGSHLGHTHPIYNISVIGTPNAHNILTTSTDGVVCSWSVDMLAQPQEYLELSTPPPAKTEDLAPTSLSFPSADPTFFVVGTEEGPIYPCHRYDRAGAKAGVDMRLAYRGHTAPVMSTHFHPAKGPVDLGDLMISSSLDWSVKLWRVKPAAQSTAASVAASSSTSASTGVQAVAPVLDIAREDLVYDAKWAPHKPSVFACVTGAGDLEVFDLNFDVEVPIAKASPTRGKGGTLLARGLNKCAWEEKRGGLIATGGLDSVVSVFEVGRGLSGGAGEAGSDEWMGVRRLVGKMAKGPS
jgi:dynein intermediate chain